MSAGGARRLAAVLAIVALAMEAVALALLVPNLAEPTFGPLGLVVGSLVLGATYPLVGWMIASRRRENPIGWIFLVVGLSQAVEALGGQYARYGLVTDPGSLLLADVASWVGIWAWVPGNILMLVLVLLFPDGHLPSRRWQPVLWVAAAAFALMFAPLAIAAWAYRGPALVAVPKIDPALDNSLAIAFTLTAIGTAMSLFVAVAAVSAVVVRFRRSSGVERQQVKWFASAGVVEVAGLLISSAIVFPPPLDAVATFVIMPLVPIATAIAILRYRLYEIDRIVSRTISYGLVTGLLIATYAGLILLLQGPLDQITGGETASVALSTLAVAGLFQPVRRRVQRAVDRRFNRARYDAEQTAAAFSARMRDEVDLANLSSDLDTTIRHAIAPRSLGIWLRESRR
jgi:hypothetical protein